MTRSARGRFVPMLETLEDRTVPAVQISQTGNIVVVAGDATNNRLIVLDNGTSKNGAVVIGDGVSGQILFALQGAAVNPGVPLTVLFQLGDGNDSVYYNLLGAVDSTQSGRNASAGRVLVAMLGTGNDVFRFAPLSTTGALFSDIAIVNAGLLVNAFGGAGDDQLSVILPGGLASNNTAVSIQLTGGTGNDFLVSVVELFQTGPGPSFAASRLDGGEGQDIMVTLLTSDTPDPANPAPTVQGTVAGDDSDFAAISFGLVNFIGVPLDQILFL